VASDGLMIIRSLMPPRRALSSKCRSYGYISVYPGEDNEIVAMSASNKSEPEESGIL
jgi:hypothetical protein